MFYLTYRPQKFSDLLGLEAIAKSLCKAVSDHTFGHAYLFSGPRGTGKTTTARLLAKALNCSKSVRGETCNQCENCVSLNEGHFLDLLEIDAASNRGIDDIRSLREKIKLAPFKGKYKIYIIDEVHMLTMEAFNALLKTLEEPPAHAIFILCTTELHKVPETIRSRCQHFRFKRADRESLVKKLAQICEQEKADVAESDLKKIAKASLGGFRDAETLLEQVISGGITIDELLSSSSESGYIRLTGFLVAGDSASALKFINQVFNDGVDLGVWTADFLEYLRDLLLISEGLGEELVEKGDNYESIEEQANAVSRVWLGKTIRRFSEAFSQLRWAAIPQFPLELAAVAVATLAESEADNSNPRTNAVIDEEVVEGTSLSKVEALWTDILEAVRPINHSTEAFLRSTRPCSFDGKCLKIEVFYKFHQERLSSSGNKAAVERITSKILGTPISIHFVLSESPPPHPIAVEGEPETSGIQPSPAVLPSPLDVFDGSI